MRSFFNTYLIELQTQQQGVSGKDSCPFSRCADFKHDEFLCINPFHYSRAPRTNPVTQTIFEETVRTCNGVLIKGGLGSWVYFIEIWRRYPDTHRMKWPLAASKRR